MAGTPRALRLGLICALCALAAGCGSHLHSKQDHELAKQAQAAFEKADVSASLDEERGLLTEMLTQELAIVRRHTLAQRDAELVFILGASSPELSWQRLATQIADRERQLAGADAAKIQAMRDAAANLPGREANVRKFQAAYEAARAPGDPALACPTPATPPAKMSASASVLYMGHAAACADYQKALATVREFAEPGSELGRLGAELAAIEAFERDVAEQASARQKAQRELEAQAKKAREAGTPIDIPKELAARRDKLAKTMAPIESKLAGAYQAVQGLGLEDLDLDAELAELEEQRQAVDQLVAFLIQGQGKLPERIPPDVQLALQIARTVPALAVEIRGAHKFPRVGALVLESEHLRLEAEALTQRRARAQQHRALLGKKRDAIIAELLYLGQARDALARVDEPSKRLPLFEAYRRSETVRRDTAEALLAYANAWTIGRVAQEEIDYMLIGLAHEAALDGSAVALAQWENLIRVPLAQLVALHGAGITSEEISTIIGHIITAAGFGAVGYGVNR
ncbi:MAG TPA: hypothetical protein VNM90_08405 [Haliangium sp.]|nr:hypothetical protein [Haliangium sp.]